MARVLLLGYDSETVDFSDPALPSGMTVEKVHAGIAVAMKGFAERGWEADLCFNRPDATVGPDNWRYSPLSGPVPGRIASDSGDFAVRDVETVHQREPVVDNR
jgi:hypothetical protein